MTEDPLVDEPVTRWLIDGNNVMGSRADGWWNDRTGAMVRLTEEIASWCTGHDQPVVLVFDGAEQPDVTILAGGNLAIRFAPRRGRNAADDLLVDLAHHGADEDTGQAADGPPIDSRPAELDASMPPIGGGAPGPVDTVVTADRGLVARLPPSCRVLGPRRFLDLVAPHGRRSGQGRGRRRRT